MYAHTLLLTTSVLVNSFEKVYNPELRRNSDIVHYDSTMCAINKHKVLIFAAHISGA